MGAIHNILWGPADRLPSVASRRLLGSATLLSAFLLIPAASLADPTPDDLDDRGKGSPVSMSPSLLTERPNTTLSLTPLEGDQTLRPLTRAAAQLKVETMSPADWLAGFGDVTVGHVDTRGLE